MIQEKDLLKETAFIQQLKYLITPTSFLIGIVASTLFINVLSLAFPIMLLQIYDSIVPNAAVYTLLLLAFSVGSALILENILRILRAFVTGWLDARYEYIISVEAFSRILNSKITDYELIGTGVYLEHLNSIQVIKDFFNTQVITIILDIPFVLVFIALFFYIAGMLVLVPLILLSVLAYAAHIFGKQLSGCLTTKREADDKRINFIISSLTNIHSIKSMALEMQMLRRYERIQEKASHADHQLVLKSATTLLSSNIISQLVTIFTLLFGAIMVIHGHLTIGGLAACILLSNRILQPVNRATTIWARLQAVKQAQKRLQEIAHLPQEHGKTFPKISTVKGELTLENISFRYTENQPWLFSNISLHINAGEMIGLQSENASGKSTLLWLMMGILTPTEGKLLIDGKNIQDYDQQSVREKIAYIPQQGVLFNGTLIENITLFRPHLTQQAKRIAEMLGLTHDIQQLPKGYETEVGKQAVETLPYGLKQRICIARALISQPKIILFDEANTTIDMRSDAILKSIFAQYRGHCTWILVSQRPSLLQLADHVYTLQHKKLEQTR